MSEHYEEIARRILAGFEDGAVVGAESCCEPAATASEARFLYARETLAGLPEGAKAASRGCGDPVAKACLQPGERVVDLGCGGGIDALIAGQLVGPGGRVYGVDMTPAMVELASRNAAQAGAGNVEFLRGTIEDLPLPDESVDVVLSNCVINFSSDKARVMREAARVLAPGGRFVISDIVSWRPIAESSYGPLCRIVGTTNGMSAAADYERMLVDAGFADVRMEPKTTYTLDVLRAKAEQKDRMAFYDQLKDDRDLDGASGSVIVVASKAPAS